MTARPEAVAAAGVDVVAAEALLSEQLVQLVVFVPGAFAAGDEGVAVLGLGRTAPAKTSGKALARTMVEVKMLMGSILMDLCCVD